MADDPFRAPTDTEIDAAEKRLNFKFHPDYREFLKGRGDVGDAVFEAAVILPGSGHLDLFEIAEEAWDEIGLSRDLLPFIMDNADYYCLTKTGGVVFWSHNGVTNEKWATFEGWYQQVCIEEPAEDGSAD
jgi:SMI1-KNR4 cell-wall